MSPPHQGIIAYGTEEDRNKLAILSKTYQLAVSQRIIKTIRDRFDEPFGSKNV